MKGRWVRAQIDCSLREPGRSLRGVGVVTRTVRAGLAAAALTSLWGCDGVVATILAFVPSPPTKEVMALLPTPFDARIESAECSGVAGVQGFTCVVQAESGVAMEAGAEQAARAMTGWTEFSWDWVPGRIQSSWTRTKETVAIAVHENGTASHWSLIYTWGDYPNPLAHGPYRDIAPQADARVPETLASLPVPSNARLLQASSIPGRPNAQAIFAVEGDPAAILAPFQSMSGWQKTLRARAPWAYSAGNKLEAKEVVATVWVGDGDKHTLVLVSQPAG